MSSEATAFSQSKKLRVHTSVYKSTSDVHIIQLQEEQETVKVTTKQNFDKTHIHHA